MSTPLSLPSCNGSTGNGTATIELFSKFFEQWLQQQSQDLDSLRSAAQIEEEEELQERHLRPLVDRVVSHYEKYYHTKSASAKNDVLRMFSPPWTTTTENLFMWVGGWRPSMAFHLLYSKSSLQLHSQLDRVISGLPTHNLADLSPQQLYQIEQLQQSTVRMEKEISEEEARAQETVADAEMVGIVEAMTEMGRKGGEREGEEMMGPEMGKKEEGMERVLEKADRLRLETLKGVVGILRPMQAVHFLIAAAELHLRVHEFGKKRDERIIK